MAAADALVAKVLKDHGRCDFLVNNAGRSIRRGIINSLDRFHDFSVQLFDDRRRRARRRDQCIP